MPNQVLSGLVPTGPNLSSLASLNQIQIPKKSEINVPSELNLLQLPGKNTKSPFSGFTPGTGLNSDLVSAASSGIASLGSLIGNKYNDNFSEEDQASQNAIRGLMSNFGPYGQAIAAATGVVDAIGSMTGTNLSNINKNAASRAGVEGASTVSSIVNKLPGISMFAGLMTGGRTNSFNKSSEIEGMDDGYSGTMKDFDAAAELSNKRMFNRSKANSFIDTQNRDQQIMADISRTNTLRKQSDYAMDLSQQNLNRYAGQNYMSTYMGKTGLKIMSVKEVREILKTRHDNELQAFKDGGKMNIIPEGTFHSRKHHLDEINEELKDVTPKGIPVVTVDESGELEQIAEIEVNEIIFTLEVTKKLEALARDGSDEAAIEAGKLLVKEILSNTNDKTGLLNEEKGK